MTRPDENPKETSLSFVEILRERAGRHSEKSAFAFLAEAGRDAEPSTRATYAELDLRARAIAAELQAMGLAGERALLLYPPGLEFLAAFFGCLYAGVVAIPAPPPRVNRPMHRLRAMVADARPRAVLTAASQRGLADRWTAGVPELVGRHRLLTDEVDEALAGRWRPPRIGWDTLAFLQYTSGSTSTPRGVMVSHG